MLQDSRGGQRRVPQTTLVAIDDEEYYGRVLAGRRPLKRDYLATLISRIAEARPLLIALDIDFRSPVPNSMSSDFDDYREEDRAMDAALCANRAKTMIVLSKAVSRNSDGLLRQDQNIYDGNPNCAIPNEDISVGYLSLPTDLRRVPLSVRTNEEVVVDSFALAIARAVRPRQYPTSIDLTSLPYGEFHHPNEFSRATAKEVLNNQCREKLRGQIVMVYGDWHVLASGRGALVVDTFQTPVGVAGGAYVHANLVETLLSANLRASPPESAAVIADALIALGLAVAFAFHISLLRKFFYIASTAFTLVLAAWLFLQVFAVFFDILPLLAAMGMHAIVDQVWEWREVALSHEAGAVTLNKPFERH